MSGKTPSPDIRGSGAGDTPEYVSENLDTLAAMHARSEQGVDTHQRFIERLTLYLGRPMFLYLILACVVVWVGVNTWLRIHRFSEYDSPPFYWLQGITSLSALTYSIMVLITQNRQARLAEQRSRLDMEINLLAEMKIAKLIALVEELRSDLPNVRDRHDPEAESMKQAADPMQVLDQIERTIEAAEI